MINSSRKRAELVELVGDAELNPRYKFSTSSIDFRNSAKDGSHLTYYNYNSKKLDEKDIKNLAMKTLEENHNKESLFGEGNGMSLFESWYSHKTINELKEEFSKQEKKLEYLKFKNWYNPFSKKFFLKDNMQNLSKILLMGLEVGGIGRGIYNLIMQNPERTGSWLSLGIFSGAIFEGARRAVKKFGKNELKEIEKNIQYYDNFRKNIENAEVKIVSPIEAENIIEKAKNSQTLGTYVKLDIPKINSDLVKSYGNKFL